MSERPELFVAFVGPVGVRIRELIETTAAHFRQFKYNPVEIRLSKLLERCAGYTPPHSTAEDERILRGQKLGHEFREAIGDAAAVAVAAIVAIREERARISG